jgi:alkylation response protein AidB-like acyl-CoA dehydrogenase
LALKCSSYFGIRPGAWSEEKAKVSELLHEVAPAIDALAARAADAAEATDAEGRFPSDVARAFLASGLAGLISAPEVGGLGGGVREAAAVVERLGRACGSTAMIVAMHYCGAAVVEAFGSRADRETVARGGALTTLAFSEAGSRSHFWAPLSTATRQGDEVVLEARKSWVTSANHADLYVWSSQATQGEGSSIWLVPRTASRTSAPAFNGLGLRGNDSGPISAADVRIPASSLLGEDGKGADIMLGTVLPIFSVLNAAAALGVMTSAVERTIAHASATRFEHLDQSLSRLPTIRAYIARMQLKTDMVRALMADTLAALANPGDATMLRVLEVKAAAGETATEVTDLAMRVCGGAAFRKDVGVERCFRDARASTVMAPTTDQLYDFIGRALCGIDLFA